jgi:hypothetical protein
MILPRQSPGVRYRTASVEAHRGHGVSPQECNCDFSCTVCEDPCRPFGSCRVCWDDPTCLLRKADCKSQGNLCRAACAATEQAAEVACAALGAGAPACVAAARVAGAACISRCCS